MVFGVQWIVGGIDVICQPRLGPTATVIAASEIGRRISSLPFNLSI